MLHHLIAGNLYDLISSNVRAEKLGITLLHGLLYVLKKDGHDVRTARVPDVSFIRKAHLRSRNFPIEGFPNIAPTLAVEVISPEDTAEAMQRKIRDYLDAGTEQVWVVFPRTHEVHVYKRGETDIRVYRGDDTMDVSDLFPGLTLSLKDIFALPELE